MLTKIHQIVVIGDSHVCVCDGRADFVLFNKYFFDGSAPTAFNMAKESTYTWINSILKKYNKDTSLILFSAGEIDCRLHIFNQYKINNIPIEELIDKTVDNYCDFLDSIDNLNFSFCVLGIPPCGRQDNNIFNFPFYGNREQRIEIFTSFNSKMKYACGGRNYNYIDMYSSTTDLEGLIKEDYIENKEWVEKWGKHGTHLNYSAFRFVDDFLLEKYSGLYFSRKDRTGAEEKKVKLHCGCGGIYIKGWINVDLDSTIADLKHDISKRFPYEDNSVDFMFSEHCIEHLTEQQGISFFKECYRLLKPEGVVRISTFDVDDVIKAMNTNSDWKAYRDSYGSQFSYIETRAQFLNGVTFYNWGHQWLYNKEELKRLMSKAGFSNFCEPTIKVSTYPELNNLETRFNSVCIVEGRK